jgi:hypothetical protein
METEHEETVNAYLRVSKDLDGIRKRVKDMQEIVSGQKKCDGLCGLCLLFVDGYGCAIKNRKSI